MDRPAAGFTLIELLLALGLMALMALMSWRGLDGIITSRQRLQQQTDQVQVVQASLAQWTADLDALGEIEGSASLDWDGRGLRLLRRSRLDPEAGWVVVAWSRRERDGRSRWLRWESAALAGRADVRAAWQQAAQWAQNPGDAQRLREVATLAIDDWQIFYYRQNAWSNPLSSAGAAPQADGGLPDGIRLVLNLSPGQALSGTLTRDWVSARVGGAR